MKCKGLHFSIQLCFFLKQNTFKNSIVFGLLKSICLLTLTIFLSRPVYGTDKQLSLDISPDKGSIQDIFELTVTVDGNNLDNVETPDFQNTTLGKLSFSGTQTQQSYINGNYSATKSFSFTLTPDASLQPGHYKTPEGSITVGGKTLKLPRKTLTIVKAAPGNSISGAAFIQFLDKEEVFTGQQILYRAELASEYPMAKIDIEDLNLPDFLSENYGPPKEGIRIAGGKRMRRFTYREALFPLKDGELEIPPRTVSLQIKVLTKSQKQARAFGSFPDPLMFSFATRYKLIPKRLIAPKIKLKVNPLPPPPQAISGFIPVGEVLMESSLDASDVKLGQALSLKIILIGDANLRPYKLPEPKGVNADQFKYYFDKPEVSAQLVDEKIQFKKTFNVTLVPRTSGSLQLPYFEIINFSPKGNTYKVQKTILKQVNILPDPNYASQLKNTGSSSTENIKNHAEDTANDNSKSLKTIKPAPSDLTPLFTGPSTLNTFKEPDTSSILIIIFLCPLLAFILLIFKNKGHFYGHLTKSRIKQNALNNALNKLDGAKIDLLGEQLIEIIKTYLMHRFNVKAPNLTTQEIAKTISEITGDDCISNKLQSILASIDKLKYSGQSRASAHISQELTKSISETLKELELKAK